MGNYELLGPPGVLPPGEWAEGAPTLRPLAPEDRWHETDPTVERGRIHAVIGGCANMLWEHVGRREPKGIWQVESALLDALRLDLSRGPLDFGTRALLSLVAPEVEQPLTAPSWEKCGSGWRLEWWDGAADCRILFVNHDWREFPFDPDVRTGIICAALDPDNPRRALCMALAHAQEER